MNASRVRVAILVCGLWGCSVQEQGEAKPDNPPQPSTATIPQTVATESPLMASAVPDQPTRSELRVLSEQNRQTQVKAKEIIARFEQHLKEPRERQALQAEFKQLLPGYKANMLRLGKAQLQPTHVFRRPP